MPSYLTKEYIQQNILSATGKISSAKLKKLPDAVSVEQIYQIWHELSGPAKCYCGNDTKFISFTNGYHTYCSAKCSANAPTTIGQRKKTNLQKYGVEAYCQTDKFAASIAKRADWTPEQKAITKKKRVNTIQSLYGVDYVLQSAEIRQKGVKTKVQKYGVEHAMQSVELLATAQATRLAKWYPAKLESLSEIVTPKFDPSQYTNIDGKYLWSCVTCGTEFTSRLSDGRIPRCPTCLPYGYRSSKIETEIVEFLQSLSINVLTSDRKIIAPQELDIVLPDQKIAVEVNGEYWHSENQGRGKEYHINKTLACQQQEYRLIHIFTSEWANNASLVKSRLKSILGSNSKEFGRKCRVEAISHLQTHEFMIENHIQGSCPSSINIGLVSQDSDDLVAVMTFGKSRYNKEIDWELLRYASKQGINVVGGASKLFSHFTKAYNPTSVISYCDLRWNTGNLYSAIGFSYAHSSPPNFRYTLDYMTFYSRQKFQKHKLPTLLETYDPNLTEWGNMKANGYDRIWDCGNSVWVWRR